MNDCIWQTFIKNNNIYYYAENPNGERIAFPDVPRYRVKYINKNLDYIYEKINGNINEAVLDYDTSNLFNIDKKII